MARRFFRSSGLRRLGFGLGTVLGLTRRGFFIPHRYAATVQPIGYDALEPYLAAALPSCREVLAEIRRAFYALCTHIDHQLRVVLGTLREENLLDDTIVMTSRSRIGPSPASGACTTRSRRRSRPRRWSASRSRRRCAYGRSSPSIASLASLR